MGRIEKLLAWLKKPAVEIRNGYLEYKMAAQTHELVATGYGPISIGVLDARTLFTRMWNSATESSLIYDLVSQNKSKMLFSKGALLDNPFPSGFYKQLKTTLPESGNIAMGFKCDKGIFIVYLMDGRLVVRCANFFEHPLYTGYDTPHFIAVFNDLTGVNICDYLKG